MYEAIAGVLNALAKELAEWQDQPFSLVKVWVRSRQERKTVMKHGVYGRKLGRHTNHRIAMWRNMAIALFTHGQIVTSIPKAKSLKPFVEKLISAAKKGDLASRRRVIARLGGDQIMVPSEDDDSVKRNKYGEVVGGTMISKHLFDVVAPRYADRTGGYTRIIKLGINRLGDGTDLCVIQLVGTEEASGSQARGSFSRRRNKANKRMEFAAARRKAAPAEPAAEVEVEAEAEAADA